LLGLLTEAFSLCETGLLTEGLLTEVFSLCETVAKNFDVI